MVSFMIEAASMALTVASRQGFVLKERFCLDVLVFKKTRIPSFHLLNCLPSGKTLLNKITDDMFVAYDSAMSAENRVACLVEGCYVNYWGILIVIIKLSIS